MVTLLRVINLINLKYVFQIRIQLLGLIITFSLLIGLIQQANAHSGKAKHHVIIDTDCAPDDLRAISIMLASSHIEVLAITTSDGMLDPEQGWVKVNNMLSQYGHQGILVGMGVSNNVNPGDCRSYCDGVFWGANQANPLPQKSNAPNIIIEALLNESAPVELICLGPLSNISQTLQESPDLISHVNRIVWYNGGGFEKTGTNYAFDSVSANNIIKSKIPIYILGDGKESDLLFNENLIAEISTIPSRYAKLVVESMNPDEVLKKIKSGYQKLWDDLVPVFFLKPELFDVSRNPEREEGYEVIPNNLEDLYEIYAELFREPISESKVFKGIPVDSALYRLDVATEMDIIISKNGIEEFRIGVLTNELHGHLGIYAIIGAKMGLRAREYFNIGIDDIQILSYAGCNPPISCTNDGLQVSTGGTFGHGLIKVPDTLNEPYPAAKFSFKNKSIKLGLKMAYSKKIKKDIGYGVKAYSLGTEAYWAYIRKLAIEYWRDLNRFEIFEITEIK